MGSWNDWEEGRGTGPRGPETGRCSVWSVSSRKAQGLSREVWELGVVSERPVGKVVAWTCGEASGRTSGDMGDGRGFRAEK